MKMIEDDRYIIIKDTSKDVSLGRISALDLEQVRPRNSAVHPDKRVRVLRDLRPRRQRLGHRTRLRPVQLRVRTEPGGRLQEEGARERVQGLLRGHQGQQKGKRGWH